MIDDRPSYRNGDELLRWSPTSGWVRSTYEPISLLELHEATCDCGDFDSHSGAASRRKFIAEWEGKI